MRRRPGPSSAECLRFYERHIAGSPQAARVDAACDASQGFWIGGNFVTWGRWQLRAQAMMIFATLPVSLQQAWAMAAVEAAPDKDQPSPPPTP